MDDVHESEQLPVYHAEVAEWAVELGGGVAPRLFVLVREEPEDPDAGDGGDTGDGGGEGRGPGNGEGAGDGGAAGRDPGEGDAVVDEVVAYGIVMPDGSAATVPISGRGFGRWLTPESASRRMQSELVWLSPA